jgi:hypothetical protein
MSADPLLRYYRSDEMFDSEGYPLPWRHVSKDGPLVWPRIPDVIREERGHRCERCEHPYEKGDPRISERGEWSPCDERCTHAGTLIRWETKDEIKVSAAPPTPAGEIVTSSGIVLVEAQWRILTVHHLDSDKANCRWWNLVALCQRCHLRMQRAVIMDREYHFEHSEWFKPYAAGFYAFKYEGRDILREEAEFRLDHFLRYEHRFTQEAIF